MLYKKDKFSYFYTLKKKNLDSSRILTYSFSFVSLFPPLHTLLLKHHYHTLPNETNSEHKGLAKGSKLRYKHSYLLMTWLKYLKFVSPMKKRPKLRFVYLPVKWKSYTFQKAPMAHKTNSQEHFKFKFFFFKITFRVKLATLIGLPSSDHGIMLVFFFKRHFPVFETSKLLLRYYKIRFFTADAPKLSYFDWTQTPR